MSQNPFDTSQVEQKTEGNQLERRGENKLELPRLS